MKSSTQQAAGTVAKHADSGAGYRSDVHGGGGWSPERSGNGPLLPTFPAGTTEHWTSAISYGLVEELFRRRRMLATGFVLSTVLIFVAVGLRMWADTGIQPVETITQGAASGSIRAPETGPPGTWQRWEEVLQQPMSVGRPTEPDRSTITTFGRSMSLTISPPTGDLSSPLTP